MGNTFFSEEKPILVELGVAYEFGFVPYVAVSSVDFCILLGLFRLHVMSIQWLIAIQ